MDKRGLVAAVAEASGLSKRAAGTAVESTIAAIVDALSTGEAVRLQGFGTFEATARAPRTARNPSTGEAVEVPARVAPRFRPSPRFREAVANRR